MNLQLSSTPWNTIDGDWLVVAVSDNPEFTGPLGDLNNSLGGELSRLKEAGDLTGALAAATV